MKTAFRLMATLGLAGLSRIRRFGSVALAGGHGQSKPNAESHWAKSGEILAISVKA